VLLFVPGGKSRAFVAEVGEPSQRLLHLLESPAAIGLLVQALFKEESNIAVGDSDRRPELMRKHMQDVIDVHRHATVERSTPMIAAGSAALRI
jgi:hypothetical protein